MSPEPETLPPPPEGGPPEPGLPDWRVEELARKYADDSCGYGVWEDDYALAVGVRRRGEL